MEVLPQNPLATNPKLSAASPLPTQLDSAPVPLCPICNKQLPGMTEQQISNHVDDCLTQNFLDGDSPQDERPIQKMSDVTEPTIVCPYPTCGVEMTIMQFAHHVLSGVHKYEPQTVFCPICKFLGEESGVDTTRLNLWAHLNGDHGDVMSVAIADRGAPINKSVKHPPPVFNSKPPPAPVRNPFVQSATNPFLQSAPIFNNAPFPPPPPPPPLGSTVSNKRPAPERVAFRFRGVQDSNARNSNSHSRYTNDYWDGEEDDENNWDSEEEDEESEDSFGDFFELFDDYSVTLRENNNNTSNLPMPVPIPPPPPPQPKITTTVTTTTTTTATTVTTTSTTSRVDIPFSMPSAVSANYMAYALSGKLPDRECSICFDDFQQGEMVARVECMCIFHQCCIEQWFQKRKCCPFHMNAEEE